MARIDVIMPQMGESIAEGTLSKWLKKVGDEVKRDEPMFEISTDKVDAEIPAPSAGVLAQIMVKEGQTVPVQTVVAAIETDKSAAGAAPAPSAPAAAAPAPVAPKAAAPAPAPAPAPVAPPAVKSADVAPPWRAPAPAPAFEGPETAEERLRRKSTPLVRKIAAEHQVDISTIPGSGLAGRVTKKDILGFIESGAAAPAGAVLPGAPPSLVPAPAPATGPSPWEATPWPGDRVEPMSRIRQLTAEHMIYSRRTSAHVTSFYEVDMHRIAKLREAHKKAFEERGAKLTYLGFIVKTIADQLRKHHVLNAAVQGSNIIYRAQINIGIAVALDWGLIVPVIRNADELSLLGIAKSMADLAERARTKKLKPEEVQGGTFTITNPGVFGSYIGAPIINQPQVAILGVGAIEKRPKVVTTDDGTDLIVPRMMTMLSISYDHRIVDGADADRFMADVKTELQSFSEGAL
ncbi:MAG: 2-oxoglutarate dehydrogenase, E2 component, dihydrolipoamide succinyltransferase [Gemmatimonadetes bacterium]|nr:2-oxoglutarate dehydrogenase, E2 component, dihydrolipoamide succinyltransferase [Gemmatimonadota bacterium]